ncbi:DNA alkylation repair protein [Clostridium culturomicium]|uniref:DNA alkylation repair protein n=1 Tax=Clostridium culturomicium TaxID=1499683 RepID=UPI000590EDEC|nr:DNA alkylation repair protein [Clostridium culturomicium]
METKDIINEFLNNKNEENAKGMKAYLKDNFEFLGVKTPLRKQVSKEFLKEKSKENFIDEALVRELWANEYREMQYIAIDYLIKQKKKLQREHITLIKDLIVTKSWWDSVDLIASHLAGELGRKYPELIEEYFLPWSESENMWLRRTAILYQLKYKENTNTDFLKQVIKVTLHQEEFFIRKAIGWSLREYSKFNQEWVREFIANNKLSKLSEKEASKYL